MSDNADPTGEDSPEEMLEEMESWFRANYEDPAMRTPYESAEGGYIWIWGGPYDAHWVLEDEFGGRVPEELIQELSETLSEECLEWAPIPREEDYDQSLFARIRANADALETFEEATSIVEGLLEQELDPTLQESMNRLLFANIIAALETYLSDTFINTVFGKEEFLRQFIETTPEFSDRKVPFSEVLKQAEKMPEEAKRYLVDVVWHNLAKVQAMYRDTLGIEFGMAMKPVAKAVPKRHDIVHRNGKGKDGTRVSVAKSDVEQLIDDVTALVYAIQPQVEALEDSREEDDELPDF